MKYAMKVGSDFAASMGDSVASNNYANTLASINSTLYNDHWNGNFVLEDVSRTKDSACIVGFNDAYGIYAKYFITILSYCYYRLIRWIV